MGSAAYNRGSRNIAREIDARISAVRATNDARAVLWRTMLDEGAILHFECAGGAVVTAGPHVTATGQRQHSVYRDHGDPRWRGSHIGTAWGVALFIIEHAGRARPYKVTHG